MSKLNFTKRALEALPVPEKVAVAHRDMTVRGLGILIQASGHRAFFWYRKVRGRNHWETIGNFPDLDIEQARAEANEKNRMLEKWKASGYEGPNPFTSKQTAVTLDGLVDDYVEKQIKPHAKRPEQAERDLRRLIKKYLAEWRTRKLADLRSEDVAALHRSLGENNGHRTANKVVKQLRTLYNFALSDKSYGGENPAYGIKYFHENKRTRFLQPDELPKLWAALRVAPNPDLRDYVNLALWTAARKSDLLSMRWQDVSLDDNRWAIPDPKSRVPYVVPLTPEAVAILKERLRGRTEGCDWVFPGVGATRHLVDLKGAWQKMVKAAGLDYPDQPELTITQHDLRRTHASWQAAQGASLLVIGKTLGHQSTDATQIYSRLALDPVRQSMSAANAAILTAMKKKQPKALKAAPKKKAAGRG